MSKKHTIMTLALSVVFLGACSDGGSSAGTDAGGSRTGTGGSTARMTISGDYLYAIAGSDVQLFNIQTPSAPNPWTKVQVAWNIETLFAYKDQSNGDYLLIGASDGLHILDNTDPGAPDYIVDFPHARAEDPVVAENGFAFVTLKNVNNGQANSGTNQLNIVDIADITNPVLIDTIPMQGPTGLSADQELLFVCDDIAGIKIFDTRDATNLSVIDFIENVRCNDLIAREHKLFVITDDNVLQYDYSSLPARLVSQIDRN